MTTTHIPLTPTFGVEIAGLDLTAPIGAAVADELREAYRNHRLLLVRGALPSAEDQARFGRVFGEIRIREHNLVKPPSDSMQHVSNVLADGVFGRGDLSFHMDQLFFQQPLSGLILCAVEVPEHGGDTCFCDTSEALAAMPRSLLERIENLTCRTSRAYDDETARRYNVSNAPHTIVSSTHRMIWTEPETGRRVLWCGRPELTKIVGLDAAESDALVRDVLRYVDTCAAVYRHRWHPGDLVLWNNRTLFHARTPYDENMPRTLRRTPLLDLAAA
jgi:alpha-ketoglutarate-dependent taurine dioxygenase